MNLLIPFVLGEVQTNEHIISDALPVDVLSEGSPVKYLDLLSSSL